MKIKTKLTLGVGLLFLLILLLGVVGASYINALKSDTESILVANYNTLEYSHNMLSSIDENTSNANVNFEVNLRKQENTITEIGENEATKNLRRYFEIYKSTNKDTSIIRLIKSEIFKIMNMNMHAIQRKSDLAKDTAETATFWIAITGMLCFLIAFTLLVNLPANIANPIRELTESIRQIADKKYSERVHFESHNEFGDLAKSFNTMAEKLQEYNNSNLAKIMMEKRRIETLINNMHDPVIGLDEELKIIFINEEAIKIIGLRQQELLGQSSKLLAEHNDLLRLLIYEFENNPVLNNSTINDPIKIYADGKESYFEKETLNISVTPTGENNKVVIGHVVILRNVTEYKELDSAKTNFIATVSHEFKTPISSIKMSLQLLENEKTGQVNAEQKNLLESIKDDTNRLLKITGELLNMTQVESGNIQLSIIPSDPEEILNYAINACSTQADLKQINLDVHFSKNLPKVQADSEKTAWVLTNLISNAIRYSYENSTIILKIKYEKNKIKYSVEDTGQGIAPQYKEKIFNRYFRVPGTKKEGTGLGLAISKEFVEAQGGEIAVESEFGSGSIFTISLNAVS